MGATAVSLLSSLGLLVIIVQAQNCSKPVGGPNMDIKGEDILLNEFPDGKKVTFACIIGYTSEGGSATITCTAGTWSTVGMRCNRRNCGAAEEVPHGQIEYQPGALFGDKAVLICDTGYMMVGKGVLTCGAQGWEGRLPVCEVIQCESPPVVVDGSFSPNKQLYDYSEVIKYNCKQGYTRNGSQQLSCSEDATFKPDPPTCIKVQCAEADIQNGKWSSGARPPYGYLSTVILECNTGYKMIGTATQKCDINSQWVPGLPNCTPQPKTTTTTTIAPSTPRKPTEECRDPRTINPALTVSNPPPYRLSEKVILSCPSGQKQGGQFTVTCGKNGVWVPEIPKCETEGSGTDSGSGVLIPVLITVLVIGLVALGFFGMRHFGVLPCNGKTKGTRRGNTEATNEGEDVALS